MFVFCFWIVLLRFLHHPVRSHVQIYLTALHIHISYFYINHSAVSIPSTSASSSATHYIWFQLAICGVECPISNFQGSVQREWCTRLSSHCAHHITTVSQHLSTAAKYSVQHCSGSHTHCATGQGQQLSDQGIHYTTGWVDHSLLSEIQCNDFCTFFWLPGVVVSIYTHIELYVAFSFTLIASSTEQ